MNRSPLDVEDKIIEIRKNHVIINNDVALLCGVDTNQVNQTVSRNTRRKRASSHTICPPQQLKFPPRRPNAFTEKDMPMLANKGQAALKIHRFSLNFYLYSSP